jgi:pimeloyl-ACP methyl ester carboxylesterase
MAGNVRTASVTAPSEAARPVSKTVELSSGAIRYDDVGEGPTVVFVHGLLVNGLLWRKVVPLLSDRFRCITPDWPLGSHPTAMNADADLSLPALAGLIAEFMAALDLQQVTLVGSDTGGALCQMVAAWHSDRLGRLVLTPCDAFDDDLPAAFMYFKVVARTPGATRLLAQSMRMALNRRLPFAYGWLGTIPDDITAAYARPVREEPGVLRDAVKTIRSISKVHTRAAAEGLPKFDRPVLIAWPRKCHFFPFTNAQRLAETFPNARLETVDGSQAFVAEDQPERLAELIADFARTPRTSSP